MITVQELEHLAKLSRIKLNESDKKTLTKEFDSILNYIDELKKVSVSTDTSSRVGVVRNVSREDKVAVADDNKRDALLNEAPIGKEISLR